MFGGFDRWLDAMSIPQRFRFSMVATTVAIVAIIGVQVWGLMQIGALHKKAEGYSGEALAAMTLEKDFTSLHRDALGYAAEPSPETLDGLTGNLRDFYTSIADTEKALVSAEHKTTLAAIKTDTDELSTILDAYVAAIKANGGAPSTAIAEKGAEIDNSIESVRDAALAAMKATAAEINQQSQTVQWLSVGVAVLFLAFITLINSRIRFTVVSTVETLTGTLSAFANGNYSVAVAGGDRTDELGVLAKAVCVLRDNSLEAIRLRGDQDLLRQAHTEELQRLGGDLEVRVGQLVGEVVQTAQALEHAANELQTMAQLVASEAEHVANGADEAGQSVQTVASATEELAASIREIASRAADVATQSNHATHNATVASERVVVLEQAASNVGSVVGFITNIADQTNLLSLNATIEAARAGEAGRGFSVVASEVKSLAQQTSSATERIGEQISSIQSSVHRAIEDISAVTEGINGLSMVSNSIASAITEQDAATAEIARAVLVAAETTQIVSNRIQEVSKAAAASEQTARSMLSEVSALSSKANGLMGEVSAFVQQIRRA